MTDTLVVVETRRVELREVSLELLGAALELKDESGGRLLVAVLDHEPERFAQAVSADGVDELLLVPTPSEHFEAHVSQRVLEELIEAERPGLVLLGHTIDSLGFGPAVAARRSVGGRSGSDRSTPGSRPNRAVRSRGLAPVRRAREPTRRLTVRGRSDPMPGSARRSASSSAS